MDSIPKKVFFTKGAGTHKDELRSFELALRDAGIEKQNLVPVSSIFPPGCKIISRVQGLAALPTGAITYTVMSRCASNEPRRLIAASVGCALPADRKSYGYLSEFHAYGMNEKDAGDHAEDMAAAMLASTMGIEFDENKSWDEIREVYHISNKVVRSMNITQSAVGAKNGFTTVLAAAVFLF